MIVDPVNLEVQYGEHREGANIQPDDLNKQDSEPDGDANNVQEGGIVYGTESGSEGNGDDGFMIVTRSGCYVRSLERLIEEIGGA
jgi:hypothetical protein